MARIQPERDNDLQIPGQVPESPPGIQLGIQEDRFQSEHSPPYRAQTYFPDSLKKLETKLDLKVESEGAWECGTLKILDELDYPLFKVKRNEDWCNPCFDMFCCCRNTIMTFYVLDETETELIKIERRVEGFSFTPIENMDFFIGNNVKLGYCYTTGFHLTMEVTNQAGDQLLTTKNEYCYCPELLRIMEPGGTQIGKIIHGLGHNAELIMFKQVTLTEKIFLMGIAIMIASDGEKFKGVKSRRRS